jgi:DNA polymerase-3 subunit delta
MAKLIFDDAIRDVSNGKLSTGYLLLGREKYFQDQFIRVITDKAFTDKGSRDLNLHILYGTENTLGELISSALSFPMLGAKKLVVVRDFDKMKITDADSLIKYLQRPQKTTALVLGAEDSGRGKWWAQLMDLMQVIECKPVPEYKLGDWIVNRVRERGFTIDQEAVVFLAGQIGSSLLAIDQELDKLANYKNENTSISLEDVEQTSGASREENLFTLQKALAQRQLPKSMKICRRLLDDGNDLNGINAILFAYFRKMLVAASLKQRGQSPKEIAENMKLPEFQLREIHEALRNFNYRQVKKIIRLLHEIDVQSKTSAINPGAGLQMLCYKICRL